MNAKEYFDKRVIEQVKYAVLSKFPLLGVTMAKLQFVEDHVHTRTAKTDGVNVFYNSNYMKNLNFEQKVFLISHEVMHVAFNHILRKKNKQKKKWNKATDAVINQLLMAEGLEKIEGCIDMPEAIGLSAEEMYELLLNEKQNEEQNNENSGGQSELDPTEEQHDLWEDVIKRHESEGSSKDNDNDRVNDSGENEKEITSSYESSELDDGTIEDEVSEKDFSKKNEDLKKQLGEQIRKDLSSKKQDIGSSKGENGYTSSFNGVGESKRLVSWKKILRRELEKEEDRYLYRRADEDNDWQARIGTIDVEDYPETEVMLDVSGSISDDFLKGFLRQLKPLCKESVLKVGCFDEFVYDKKEIKSIKDIDNFSITRTSTWTENWDAAVRSFSKKRCVNKIIFTDGEPCPGVMPKDDLKKVNVIWLVFSNKSFSPCCGKVIFVEKQELKEICFDGEDFSM